MYINIYYVSYILEIRREYICKSIVVSVHYTRNMVFDIHVGSFANELGQVIWAPWRAKKIVSVLTHLTPCLFLAFYWFRDYLYTSTQKERSPFIAKKMVSTRVPMQLVNPGLWWFKLPYVFPGWNRVFDVSIPIKPSHARLAWFLAMLVPLANTTACRHQRVLVMKLAPEDVLYRNIPWYAWNYLMLRFSHLHKTTFVGEEIWEPTGYTMNNNNCCCCY
jgi:hypothetical protein